MQTRQSEGGPWGLSYRTIAGGVVALLVVIFIALNRDKTDISFIVFTASTALWIALTIAAVGGFVAGFLVSRRRYRR
jgi:uncharacterized integral membrane protein